MLSTEMQGDTRQLSPDVLLKAIQACVENGEKLLDESYHLEFERPPSSQFFLVMIAQEEFAKAFMLHLVREGTGIRARRPMVPGADVRYGAWRLIPAS
jgi:hypothetical protein